MDKKEIAHPLTKLVNPEIPILNKLEWFGIKPGLKRIKYLLQKLGNPEKNFRSILIAGTNGKGSVAAMLYSIMSHHGYKTGLYTSPHLVSICERFRCHDGLITEKELVSLSEKVMRCAGAKRILSMGITYFEFTTALALCWFAEKKIDIAVLEVGMGGRWDATNAVPADLSIITNISRDHTAYLGDTIQEIAREKAGIIKKHKPIITGTKGIALRAIKKISRDKNAPLYVSSKDFCINTKSNRHFDYHGIFYNINGLLLNLKGRHQMENAALAIAGAELLTPYGYDFIPSGTRLALMKVPHYGRFEVLEGNPPVVLDGAHNPEGMRAFTNTLNEFFPGHRFHIIFGAMRDKDIKGMLNYLIRLPAYFYITRINNPRAEFPENILKFIPGKSAVKLFRRVEDAFMNACKNTGENDVICITGSLYLVGEFLLTFQK